MPAVLIRYFRTRNQVATKEVQPLRSDLARLAKQYVVEHSPSMGSQQKDEDHAKSFCAVVLYPFEPKLPVEPAERFVKLSVGQLVEVTHETRNGFAQDEDEGSCGVAFGASQPSVEFQAAGGKQRQCLQQPILTNLCH